MNRSLLLFFVLGPSLLAGCGGGPSSTDDGAGTGAGTAGGEVTDDGGSGEPDGPVEPVVLRTTIPVPVPQPAVPREQLSEALQAVWTRVEEEVSNGRPEGPEPQTLETVQTWVDGPFTEWLEVRRDGLTALRPMLAEIAEEPPWERAVALALWAYAFEDFGAQVAGAPVPEEITGDAELLGIYIESLNEASVPLGERAIELYADCRARLASLGDDSEWLPWRAYCVQRGQEVIEGYHLTPPEPVAPEAGGSGALEEQ